MRVEPEPKRHADRPRARLEQRDRAVDAAAHRDGHPVGVPARRESPGRAHSRARRPAAPRRRPLPPRAATARAGRSSRPGASASTIRPPSTRSRTAAQSAPRAESPKSSTIRPGYWRSKGVRGAEAPLTMLRRRRFGHAPCEPGQARWVPCRTSGAWIALAPTRAPFHMVLVLHGGAAHERRRALVRHGTATHLARAYDHSIVCTPRRPSRRASASVRSNCRPAAYGPAIDDLGEHRRSLVRDEDARAAGKRRMSDADRVRRAARRRRRCAARTPPARRILRARGTSPPVAASCRCGCVFAR